MPTIYLLRHGQASFGTDDYDVLSDLGVHQARVAGAELDRRELRAPLVVSGTLQRQRDTATLAAAQFDRELYASDPRWNEFDAHALVDTHLGGPGTSSELTSGEFQEVLDVAKRDWMAVPGEGWHAFADGAFAALSELAAAVPRGSDAVVATSAGVIAAVVTRVLGAPAETAIALNRVMINASLTVVTASPRRLSVLVFNDHAHLLAEPGLVTFR
jgi:broad specificity phosphatase PhoE